MEQLETDLDIDGDGTVTFDEYVEVLTRDNFWHDMPPVEVPPLRFWVMFSCYA